MNGNGARSRLQPHPLASATGVDQRRDVFILTRDQDPPSIVCKLLSNAGQRLTSKALSEDTLSVHETTDVPSGKACHLQGLRRKAIAMSTTIRRSPPHPVGEFCLRIVAGGLQAVRFQRRVGKQAAFLRS